MKIKKKNTKKTSTIRIRFKYLSETYDRVEDLKEKK